MGKEPSSRPYETILVPFDGSEGSTKALRRALQLAREEGASVTAFSVDENVPRYAKGVGEVEEEDAVREGYFDELRAKAQTVAREEGVHLRTETAVGHAAQSILQYAEEQNFDLIVIGHSGHSGIWGTLLGSTTARVVDQASRDVLVVR